MMEFFKLIFGTMDVFVYVAYYAYVIIFTIRHRKDIYKAACGGNGMPQPNELVKLFSVYSLVVYSNEVIHSNVEFNMNFGVFLLACIGIANLGRFSLDKIKDIVQDNSKEEKKEH